MVNIKINLLGPSVFHSLIIAAILTVAMHKAYSAQALLIGVTDYQESPLSNPVNDVRLLAKSLRERGWGTKELINPSSHTLKSAVRDFLTRSQNQDEPSMIYFSGHGLQFKGENYLLPADSSASNGILRSALSITELGMLSKSRKGPKIFIIDACRNSPLGKETLSASSGLNSQFAPPNSVIAYATAPGDFALDGTPGGNSPYARALANSIKSTRSLDSAFKAARIETMRLTSGKQIPWESSSLYSEVFLDIRSNPSSFQVNVAAEPARPPVISAPPTAPSANPLSSNPATATSAIPLPRPNLSMTVTPALTDPSIDGPFISALSGLKILIESSPLSSFEKWNGESITERDRTDFLLTIESERKRFFINKRGVTSALIKAIQKGVFHPKCRKGIGIDDSCGDFDRYFKFTPDLALSLELSKLAHERKIRSDSLAEYYKNGWLVEKDLVKAYELYESERILGGEYWATDINRMIQIELNRMGREVIVDGDFGLSSCKALRELTGIASCARIVPKNQVAALMSKNRSNLMN